MVRVGLNILAAPVAGSSGGSLHGLILAHNGPSMPALVNIDTLTGNVTQVGPALNPMDGTGDLGTIDSTRGVFFYLGDTSGGATLVGLSMQDGTISCSVHVPLREISFVGIGQSLDYDASTDELILTGIAMAPSGNHSRGLAGQAATTHAILKGPAAQCRPNGQLEFKQVGSFPIADYLPMLHSSTLDAKGQKLYVIVSLTKDELAVAVIDLATMTMTKTVAESAPDDAVNGLVWDSIGETLAGVSQSSATGAPGLVLRRLDVATGKWSSTPITSEYGYVGGNAGTVKAMDTEKGILYAEICNPPTNPNDDCTLHIAGIDLASSKVVTAPAMQMSSGRQPFILTIAWSSA
eukprot:gene17297-6575_t